MTIDLFQATIQQLRDGLASGSFTSVQLVKAYLARIEEVNDELHCIIETNQHAVKRAEDRDKERSIGSTKLGLLHGIPIILKDNIATTEDGMQTTAGSHALVGAVSPRPAFIVTRLLAEGAIILAKANMSEWAYFRGDWQKVASGWSGRGGQCTNPYLKGGDPSGSSGGSAVAAAVGLAAGTIGTETDGSIISPSRINNVVGIKPTVGLTSRSGIIPISEHQDSAGPICRTVSDAAIVLQAIVGVDESDTYTKSQPPITPDYLSCLKLNALEGVRLGVPRDSFMEDSWIRQNEGPGLLGSFQEALKTLTELGATIVEDVKLPNRDVLTRDSPEREVLYFEFKHCLNKYLSELIEVPTGVRSIADIVKFNNDHRELERPPRYEDHSKLEIADKYGSYMDEKYQSALELNQALGKEYGIDYALKEWHVDALVFPSKSEMVSRAAMAGYPVLTVPLGFTHPSSPVAEANPTIMTGPNLPFGLGFTSTAFTESKLLSYAYAFEQRFNVRGTFGGKARIYAAAVPTSGL